MLKNSDDNVRLWVIPFLKTTVWVSSFFVSILHDFGNMKDPRTIRGLMLFCTIGVLSDIILDFWNTMCSIKDCKLKRDDWWIVQLRTLPFFILVFSFSAKAYFAEWKDVEALDFTINGVWLYVLSFGISLGLLKEGVSHIDVYVEQHKIPNIGFEEPLPMDDT